MAYSCLSTWPLILFGIVEPLALVWAWITVLTDPFRFFSDQAPNHPMNTLDFAPQAQGMTFQMGNIFLLLAALAIICCWTKHAEIAKWYLITLAFADLGHVYGTYIAVGPDFFMQPNLWNDMVWGSVGASAFLHVNRWATVAGMFGPVLVQSDGEGRKKRKAT